MPMVKPRQYIQPKWRAPQAIRAWTTTKNSVVIDRYDGSDWRGYQQQAHEQTRDLPCPALCWLQQGGSGKVYDLDAGGEDKVADAVFTRSQRPCVVLTADCPPIFLTDQQSSFVAMVHAGWRNLHQGVIGNTLEALRHRQPQQIIAAIGPYISRQHYEVQEDFLRYFPDHSQAFKKRHGRWYLDLSHIIREQLQASGVVDITTGEDCTYDGEDLCSFRGGDRKQRLLSVIMKVAPEQP